jgi:hypothetical protein
MKQLLFGLAFGLLAGASAVQAVDADGKLRIIAFGAHPEDAE